MQPYELEELLLRVMRRVDRLEHNDRHMEREMADITTALSDLDGLFTELEADIQQLRNSQGADVQAVADQLEAKIAAARAAVADVPVPPAS
jgi:chromosome segregation ATPase